MANTDRLTVSVKEAAAMLGISKNLGYDLARRGELPGMIRLGQKRIVVSKMQIENLIRGDNNGRQGRNEGCNSEVCSM